MNCIYVSLPCSFFLIITYFSEGAFLFKIDFTEPYARKVATLERVSNKQVVPQLGFSSSDTNIMPFAPWVYLLFYDLSLKKQIVDIITIKLLIPYGLCFLSLRCQFLSYPCTHLPSEWTSLQKMLDSGFGSAQCVE